MNQATTHPEYIWWNGERRPWDECTIHVTELGWSTVGAVFEGIRAYTATMTSSTSFVCASIWSGWSAPCDWCVSSSNTTWTS